MEKVRHGVGLLPEMKHPASVVATEVDALSSFDTTQKLLAVDLEGIDLGRHGQISLVQIATPTQCFVVDVLDRTATDPLVQWLRCLLEDPTVTKIIHDCRMDADALLHCLGIRLCNVHDTSQWHKVAAGVPDISLNRLLEWTGQEENGARSADVYKQDHAFWRQRPLTPAMISWASGDVTGLFGIYTKQRTIPPEQQDRARGLSEAAVQWARQAQTRDFTVHSMGRFIGAGGANVRALRTRTGTLMYHRGERSRSDWVLYYDTEAAADEVCQVAQL